jgi:flagellin FlaB
VVRFRIAGTVIMTPVTRKEGAFTGLEAAVVLIAFVVVAAVFSYVILNTGFMVSQKSQEVIYSAVAQAGTSIGIAGNLYGVQDPDNPSVISQVNFTCSLATGGTPLDFEKVVIKYSNATVMETLARIPGTYNPAGCVKYSGTWAITSRLNDPGAGNNLLEPGEQFAISICPSQPIVKEDNLHLEILPTNGASVDISRRVPNRISPLTYFH